MKASVGVLKVTALVLCVVFAMAGCDFLIDDDYDDVMTDDAALYGFFMEFITAFSEFVAQDSMDVEAVDASMLHPFFREPVYVDYIGTSRWDRYMYWGGDNDLRTVLVNEFETSMGIDVPTVRYRVESIAVSDSGYGYYGFSAYPPGRHLWVNLYVRRTENSTQRDLGVWTVGVVVEGDKFFIWFISDLWDPPLNWD